MSYLFEWNTDKEADNFKKHGVLFKVALEVFADPQVIHLEDPKHSSEEDRFYAVGRISTGDVITVRYTMRENIIRILGAARWRKWRKFYEKNTNPR